MLVAASAIASVDSDRGLSELSSRVAHAKRALTREKSVARRIAELEKLRSYVISEIEKQRAVKKPDMTDNQLALTLIGLDDDLGSFLDGSSADFSEQSCAGHRITLISSYSGAGTEDRSPANLPLHAQDSLELLDLLCRS
jgi:hypothetical protein